LLSNNVLMNVVEQPTFFFNPKRRKRNEQINKQINNQINKNHINTHIE